VVREGVGAGGRKKKKRIIDLENKGTSGTEGEASTGIKIS
jgi:hypothetical protein